MSHVWGHIYLQHYCWYWLIGKQICEKKRRREYWCFEDTKVLSAFIYVNKWLKGQTTFYSPGFFHHFLSKYVKFTWHHVNFFQFSLWSVRRILLRIQFVENFPFNDEKNTYDFFFHWNKTFQIKERMSMRAKKNAQKHWIEYTTSKRFKRIPHDEASQIHIQLLSAIKYIFCFFFLFCIKY